jgi:2'-5' RNA ligase
VVDARRLEGDDTGLPLSSALVVILDGSGGFDEVRRDHSVEAVALGIPFHVTLLYPFAPRGDLTDELLSETGAFFAGRRSFEFELTRIATWPRVVYAVPEPDDELRDLMRALFARFPQWPPYEGIHDEVVPHATLGEEVDAAAVRDEIELRVAPLLPRRCQARAVALLEEFEAERWRERERFPLGAQAKAGA